MSANILKYLRTHGEQLDADISKALKIPKAQLDKQLTDLLSAGEIICCHVTRYNGDKKNRRYELQVVCTRTSSRSGQKTRG